MAFPTNPTNGQQASLNGVLYTYNSNFNAWKKTQNVANIYTSTQLTNFTNIFDFDDVSYLTDGFTNTFPLRWNGSSVTCNSPFTISVTVNGMLQPAFDYKYDTVWLANILTGSKGYTIDLSGNVTTNGYLKFADSVPADSQILVRTVLGSPQTSIKTYPFKPLDIVMGF